MIQQKKHRFKSVIKVIVGPSTLLPRSETQRSFKLRRTVYCPSFKKMAVPGEAVISLQSLIKPM